MAASIPRILKQLTGRYPLTMLGSWNERRVPPFELLYDKRKSPNASTTASKTSGLKHSA